LSQHIDGIKKNFILDSGDQLMRTKAFRTIQCLEKDLSKLYDIELSYLQKLTNNQSNSTNNNNKKGTKINFIDKLVHQSPIGIFQKSELGQSMRLYYYISPLDLIQFYQKRGNGSKSFKNLNLNSLKNDDIVKNELGCFVNISLKTSIKLPINGNVKIENATNDITMSNSNNNEQKMFKLPDISMLSIGDKGDNIHKVWHEALNPYFNTKSSISFSKYANLII
jgi:hypothetical protein